jgi:hypothetical protein
MVVGDERRDPVAAAGGSEGGVITIERFHRLTLGPVWPFSSNCITSG